MLPPQHESAQLIADRADAALAKGEVERAEALYIQAAELEAEALAVLPSDKRRTIGILGVSLASLWYRASRYKDAERVARELLEEHDLLPTTRSQLEDVLSAIPQSVSVASGGAILTLAPQEPPRPAPLRVVEQLRAIQHDAAREQAFESLYLEHRSLLLYVTTSKFHIPDTDAEALVQEVFAAFAEQQQKTDDARGWLVAAACNASRHYWRAQGRLEALPENYDGYADPASTNLAEHLATQMTVRQALQYLEPRHRNALIMHYFEGRTAREIAEELQTTPRYAERILQGALRRV